MTVSKLRLDQYVSMARVPTLAAMAGAVLVNAELKADIVYEEVMITVAGFHINGI